MRQDYRPCCRYHHYQSLNWHPRLSKWRIPQRGGCGGFTTLCNGRIQLWALSAILRLLTSRTAGFKYKHFSISARIGAASSEEGKMHQASKKTRRRFPTTIVKWEFEIGKGKLSITTSHVEWRGDDGSCPPRSLESKDYDDKFLFIIFHSTLTGAFANSRRARPSGAVRDLVHQ